MGETKLEESNINCDKVSDAIEASARDIYRDFGFPIGETKTLLTEIVTSRGYDLDFEGPYSLLLSQFHGVQSCSLYDLYKNFQPAVVNSWMAQFGGVANFDEAWDLCQKYYEKHHAHSITVSDVKRQLTQAISVIEANYESLVQVGRIPKFGTEKFDGAMKYLVFQNLPKRNLNRKYGFIVDTRKRLLDFKKILLTSLLTHSNSIDQFLTSLPNDILQSEDFVRILFAEDISNFPQSLGGLEAVIVAVQWGALSPKNQHLSVQRSALKEPTWEVYENVFADWALPHLLSLNSPDKIVSFIKSLKGAREISSQISDRVSRFFQEYSGRVFQQDYLIPDDSGNISISYKQLRVRLPEMARQIIECIRERDAISRDDFLAYCKSKGHRSLRSNDQEDWVKNAFKQVRNLFRKQNVDISYTQVFQCQGPWKSGKVSLKSRIEN